MVGTGCMGERGLFHYSFFWRFVLLLITWYACVMLRTLLFHVFYMISEWHLRGFSHMLITAPLLNEEWNTCWELAFTFRFFVKKMFVGISTIYKDSILNNWPIEIDASTSIQFHLNYYIMFQYSCLFTSLSSFHLFHFTSFPWPFLFFPLSSPHPTLPFHPLTLLDLNASS